MFRRIGVLGAGHIGQAIVHLLHQAGDQVSVADHQLGLAQTAAAQAMAAAAGHNDPTLPARGPICAQQIDAADPRQLADFLVDCDAVVNALPFQFAIEVAQAAVLAGVHYFDLTEDVAATRRIRQLARGSDSVLMPQCGLAPGFIGILGNGLLQGFDSPETLKLRVGALPRFPVNALRYNLTWSVDGLINEYCNPCDAIVDGAATHTAPLEGYQRFVLDGAEYEAFNTSGGLGTLCETWAPGGGSPGGLRSLDYKSIRYPGHHAVMKLLLEDLGLARRRDLLKQMLQNAIGHTDQDVVVILASASGRRDGVLIERSWSHRIHGGTVAGMPMTAIQLTTATGLCTALDLVRQARLPQAGFVAQEQVVLEDFLANRFGRWLQADRPATYGLRGLDATSPDRQVDGRAVLV